MFNVSGKVFLVHSSIRILLVVFTLRLSSLPISLHLVSLSHMIWKKHNIPTLLPTQTVFVLRGSFTAHMAEDGSNRIGACSVDDQVDAEHELQ